MGPPGHHHGHNPREDPRTLNALTPFTDQMQYQIYQTMLLYGVNATYA